MAIGKDGTRRPAIAVHAPWLIAAAALLATGSPASAQQPGQPATAQSLPAPALQSLNSALDDLARSPNDAYALTRAGWASLSLDDTQAALGFFRRAEAATPANGEAKAGEASALLRLDDPASAVRLFAAAEATGTPMANYAGDRGLALDLVGQNYNAQRYYKQALAAKYDPEIVRRLALSQAISGDEASAEATLLPLLQRQDLSAYRTRAFALAIVGKGEEAVAIAERMMPANLSNRMAPYLRYMPRLTRAQQAAAANLGEFPPAAEIGHDSPAIAALASLNPPQVAQNSVDSRLVPSGQPLGRTSGDRRDRQRDKADKKNKGKSNNGANAGVTNTALAQASTPPPPVAAAPPPRPQPVRAAVQQPPPIPAKPPVSPSATTALASADRSPAPLLSPPRAAAQPLPAPQAPARQAVSAPVSPAPSATAPLQPPGPPVRQLALPAGPAEQPPAGEQAAPSAVVVATLDQSPGSAGQPPATAEVPRPSLSISPPPAPAAKAVSLADAFADFSTKDTLPARDAPDAVDITKIKPTRNTAKPAAKAATKPKPPANPSRIWVQIGTGRNVGALSFTWRRLQKDAGPLLARHDPYSAKWGQTRRLVTGPYKSDDDARDAIKALKKKGIDAFQFTSDDGEEVTPLK